MKKLLFILFILFLSSCADVDRAKENLCLGVTCSNHGKCNNNYNKNIPECVCEKGYISIGAECVIDCSIISHSSPNLYNTKCECDRNYDETMIDNKLVCKKTKCDLGYKNIDNKCVYDCRYLKNSHSVGNSCICNDGYKEIGGVCTYICDEAKNLIVNEDNNGCDCKERYFSSRTVENLCIDPCVDNICSENRVCGGVDAENYICECGYGKKLTKDITINISNDRKNNDREMKLYKLNNLEKVVIWTKNKYINEETNIDLTYINILNSDYSSKTLFKLGDNFDRIQPDLAVGSDKMVIVWRDRRNKKDDKFGNDIYLAEISFTGEIIKELRVTPEQPALLTNAYKPKIIWNNAKSNYGIFWQESRENKKVIKYAIYNEETISTPIIISDTNKDSTEFNVTLSNDNNYSVVWGMKNKHNYRVVYFQTVKSDVSDETNYSLIEPKQATFLKRNINLPEIIKRENHYDIFYKSSGRLYMTQLDFNGNSILRERVISSKSSITAYNPIWNNNGYDIIFNYHKNIYLTQISAIGKELKTVELINYGFADDVFAKDDTTFIWRDNREETYNIYINKADCY